MLLIAQPLAVALAFVPYTLAFPALIPLHLEPLGEAVANLLPGQFSRSFDRPQQQHTRVDTRPTNWPSAVHSAVANILTQTPLALATPVAVQTPVLVQTPINAVTTIVAETPIAAASTIQADSDEDVIVWVTRTSFITMTSDIPDAVSSVQNIASTTIPVVTLASAISTVIATSTSSVVALASAAPAIATSNKGKRGLCYDSPAYTKLFTGGKVSWMYNWAQTSGSGTNPDLVFVPMLWSDAPNLEATWVANASAAIAAGATALLAFNEPDLSTQSNMPVTNAVSAYKKYMQPFAGKARLVSPAVTNSVAPGGLTYLQSFLTACTGCTIDVIAIHYYAGPDPASFKSYVQQAYAAGGNRPLWITEIGVSGTAAQVKTFLTAVLPWLDSLSYVERYAYFMAAPSGDGTLLLNAAGTGLDDIGTLYNTL